MSNKDSIQKTLTVALLLCIVCSVIVSSAAVWLRPLQVVNKEQDRRKNILLAAGLYNASQSIEQQFSSIQTRWVDLDSGRFVAEPPPAGFDQRKAAKDPAQSRVLSGDEDLAKISRRENRALVYIVESASGFDKVILPIHGYGLWSTLYGFIALEADLNTIAGLGFYDHGETPGLGGEVDNPRWKAQWPGKHIYRDGQVAIAVLKGASNPASAEIDYQVDGLSGATLTSRGISNLLQFWLGSDGFQPFLLNLKAGEA